MIANRRRFGTNSRKSSSRLPARSAVSDEQRKCKFPRNSQPTTVGPRAPPTVIARSPWLACPVQRDAGDSAERAGLRSSPDCQAEDALFAARSLQAQHLVLSAPSSAVVATT